MERTKKTILIVNKKDLTAEEIKIIAERFGNEETCVMSGYGIEFWEKDLETGEMTKIREDNDEEVEYEEEVDDVVDETPKKKKAKQTPSLKRQVKYTDEIVDRVKEVVNEKSNQEIADMLKSEFGINVSKPSVANMMWTRDIRRSENQVAGPIKKKYNDKHFGWLRKNVGSFDNGVELLKNFNEKFDMDISQGALAAQLSINGINMGFKKKKKVEVQEKPVEVVTPEMRRKEEFEKTKRKGMSKEVVELIQNDYLEMTDEELRGAIADKFGAFFQVDKIKAYRESNGMARPEGWNPDDFCGDDDDN